MPLPLWNGSGALSRNDSGALSRNDWNRKRVNSRSIWRK